MLGILFVVLMVVILVASAFSMAASEDKTSVATIAFSGLALFILLVTIFAIAPDELGMSRVPEQVEEFSKRLYAGRMYHLIASHQDGSDSILLVSEDGSNRYYAIRVKVSVPVPERFTLINGQPRAIK